MTHVDLLVLYPQHEIYHSHAIVLLLLTYLSGMIVKVHNDLSDYSDAVEVQDLASLILGFSVRMLTKVSE